MAENGADLALRLKVKVKLDEHGLTNKWLLKRLLLSGMNVTATSLSLALTGSRVGVASDLIILKAWDELMLYERRMMDHASV